jgi:hypothetical protein
LLSLNAGEWEGLDGMGEEILNELRPRAEALVKQGLLLAESAVKRRLSGARSGRTYRVSRTGRLHVASAPGESPAVMFGNLRNSIGHSGPTWEGYAVGGEYGPGLGTMPGDATADPMSYARRLELGGVDSRGVMIEARPYMAPAAEEVRPVIERLFEEGV